MDIACDDLRERLHLRALERLVRDQLRLGEARVEILDDCERLRQHASVDLERGHETLRVQPTISGLIEDAVDEPHRHELVRAALEIQRSEEHTSELQSRENLV